MIGKKNIVFGFLYLVLTAALGPYMVKELLPPLAQAQAQKQSLMGTLQLQKESGYENQKTLAPMSAEEIAKADTSALLALNDQLNAQSALDAVKGGPHTHGNLEALLNIAAGLALCFIAVVRWFKQVTSWVFILGALLHSGMLYLAVVFHIAWAGKVLDTGIGPILILLGLLLAGIAAAAGFRNEVVKDSRLT